MTAPDVAALAAALADHRHEGHVQGTLVVRRDHIAHMVDGFHCEEPIIAALAAQGWRITFDPEPDHDHPGIVFCKVCVEHHAEDGPHTVSAQAAPETDVGIEMAEDVRQHGPSCDYLASEGWPKPCSCGQTQNLAMVEHAAVRAALEGLRAEIAALDLSKAGRQPFVVSRTDALRIIDARLAALDA